MNRKKRLKWTPMRVRPLKKAIGHLKNDIALKAKSYDRAKTTDPIIEDEVQTALAAYEAAKTRLSKWETNCPIPLRKVA